MEATGMTGRFEEVPHTADVSLQVEAASLAELLALAGEGMFTLMFGPRQGEPTVRRTIEVSAESHTDLLWEWLSTLLSWGEVDRAAFWEEEVEVDGTAARGVVRGCPTDGLSLVGPPVKAVTYHQLDVSVHGMVWEATIIFDT